jgi:transposase
MAWFRIALTEEQQRIVNQQRDSHPLPHVRRKMLSLWLLHHGLSRHQAAAIVGIGRATVQRYVAAFRQGGLDGLRRWDVSGPVSALADHEARIRDSLEQKPVRTIAEACARIEEVTGLSRKPSQVRKFLKGMGLSWQRVRAIPVPPEKS